MAAYDDLTAIGSAADVPTMSDVGTYNVVIMGFIDANGQPVKSFGANAIANLVAVTPNALHLMSVGGSGYTFPATGIDVGEIAKFVATNGLDGVDFDIEAVDTTGTTPTAWLELMESQLKSLREQLQTSMTATPVITLAPAILLQGDIGNIQVEQPQVVARTDLPLSAWIQDGLFDAVVVQAYNGITAEQNPQIISAVYTAIRQDVTFDDTAVLIGIPVSPGGTYAGEWGTYQLWNGSAQYPLGPDYQGCPAASADVANIAAQIVSQVNGFQPGDGLSGWALNIDADPTDFDVTSHPPYGVCPTLPLHTAGYFTSNVAAMISKTVIPVPTTLYLRDMMGVSFSCNGTQLGNEATAISGTTGIVSGTVSCTDPVDQTVLTYATTGGWSSSVAKVTCALYRGTGTTPLGTLCTFLPTTLSVVDDAGGSAFTCNAQAITQGASTTISGTSNLSTTSFSCTDGNSTEFSYSAKSGWTSSASSGVVACSGFTTNGTTCTFLSPCQPYTVQSGQTCYEIGNTLCSKSYLDVLFEQPDCTVPVTDPWCVAMPAGQVLYYNCTD